jgi:hypothetical protein
MRRRTLINGAAVDRRTERDARRGIETTGQMNFIYKKIHSINRDISLYEMS